MFWEPDFIRVKLEARDTRDTVFTLVPEKTWSLGPLESACNLGPWELA